MKVGIGAREAGVWARFVGRGGERSRREMEEMLEEVFLMGRGHDSSDMKLGKRGLERERKRPNVGCSVAAGKQAPCEAAGGDRVR